MEMLLRGATPYGLAKLLGDTVDTIEKHYAPFVKELRYRSRRIMENGQGLEDCMIIAKPTAKPATIQ